MRGLKFFFILFLPTWALSQWLWDYGGYIGASNYLGDIGGKEKTRRDFIADIKMAKTRWNAGIFVRYKWMPKISFKLAFDYLRIEGDDALSTNPGRRFRNFNFKNDVFALSPTAEVFFYEDPDLGNTYRYRNSFRAYVFGGLSVFYHSPKTLYKGEKVRLRDYETEGYAYKRFVLALPTGIGFYFTFQKKHRIGYEFAYFKTFTDYLDDISKNYPSTPPSDAYTQGLIIRKNELPPDVIASDLGAYYSHDWGQKRGDPRHKDAILLMNISYSYVIRGKSSFYRAKGFKFFNRKKRVVRRVRAKF